MTGDVVLPAPFTVGVGATTPPVVTVAPTEPGWAWLVVERVQGGSPHKRLLTVPNVGTVVDYVDLVEVDPATLAPTAAPQADWWAALQLAVIPDPGDPDAVILGGISARVPKLDGGNKLPVKYVPAPAAIGAATPADVAAAVLSVYNPTVASIVRDSAGRVQSLTEGGIAVTLTRDTSGRVATVDYGGTSRTITRDASGRVTGVS